MIFHHALDQIYGQRTKLSVLRFLVLSGGGHNGREIARRIGISPMTCHDVLAELLGHGILDRQRVGRAYLYTLRDEHVLVRNVLRPAFQYEAKLLEHYTEELREAMRTPVLSLILFGSTVRQEESAGSDVDLLAIVPAEEDVEALEDEASERAYELALRYGNSPQLAVLSSQRFRRAAADREAFAQEVLRTGRVVHGLAFTELLSFQWPKDD